MKVVQTNTVGRPVGDIGANIKKVEDQLHLPPGYRFATQVPIRYGCLSAGYAITAITLSIVFIYIVLGSTI